MSTAILLTGASGYVGGSILSELVKLPHYHITALVRQEGHATLLKETYAINTVVGSLDDVELMERLASEADVIIDTAIALHPPSSLAFISGLAKRQESTAQPTHYIRTSGTGIISDNALGEESSDSVFSDTDDFHAVLSAYGPQDHRAFDALAAEAGAKQGVKTYVVLLPTVFGIGTGLFHRTSIQVPQMIHAAISAQEVHTIGDGLNIWTAVSITDLVSLYLLIVSLAIKSSTPTSQLSPPPHSLNGYYFAETGEFSFKELATHVVQALDLKAPTAWGDVQDAANVLMGGNLPFTAMVFGSNSRVKAVRGRSIGWAPQHTVQDMWTGIPEEVQAVQKGL